ncbi:MAG: T9SS type A sorting domain-containing protein [Bacteroidetes bacterium]|nr:T9SS type A sorting domain-containing protein [Bacteroidota bacterium]MBU1718549.1 T9SS type A sorting domain-containing protein [Bacteroidota bacterium]
MKKLILPLIAGLLLTSSIGQAQQTFLKIVLDTKLMVSLDCSLGGGSGNPATATKVYAHLGLCTCKMVGTGASATRDCSNETENENYCLQQITPYRSNVWQHVVGNWGDNPQDDGVGIMTSEGNGVFTIEFIIEDYFTNSAIVSTVSEDPNVVASTVWNPAAGGQPYTLGMVFRNEDASLSGRDDLCSDLFIVDMQGTPVVEQGSDIGSGFPAITFLANGLQDALTKEKVMSTVYPNPVVDNCRFRFIVKEETSKLVVKVYNIAGEVVYEFNAGKYTPGIHEISWDASSGNGSKLPAGVYKYEILCDNQVLSINKIIIVQ